MERIKALVERIERERAGEGPWSTAEALCDVYSIKLMEALQAHGLDARLTQMDGNTSIRTTDGKLAFGKSHYYLTQGSGSREVIVDPTIRQFFRGAPATVPAVFIGTEADLKRLFREHADLLQMTVDSDPLTGRYEPDSFADLTHGFGRHAKLRVVL